MMCTFKKWETRSLLLMCPGERSILKKVENKHLFSPEIYECFSGYCCYHYHLDADGYQLGVNTILKYISEMINLSKKRYVSLKNKLEPGVPPLFSDKEVLVYDEFFTCMSAKCSSTSKA